MSNLFVTDESIETSPPVVGYRIMQLLEKKDGGKISIFEVTDKLKKEKWFSSRHLFLGMVFLYSVGIIEFNQPYIVKNV
ncbi:hypothetical protein LPB140_03405 [Sphingorhabdus lutea]|uniref:Uncharacterized protein n=1 Tax=Sphingorhabdus lutea TaxID=1913578 RepID=A0A1L3JA59_9SPHN|nr:hypothetical protein [Sphingorhabdus lutea]APG62020.1 hypothetical protein LPB140_03405 [Sphingorhabdus lutea]